MRVPLLPISPPPPLPSSLTLASMTQGTSPRQTFCPRPLLGVKTGSGFDVGTDFAHSRVAALPHAECYATAVRLGGDTLLVYRSAQLLDYTAEHAGAAVDDATLLSFRGLFKCWVLRCAAGGRRPKTPDVSILPLRSQEGREGHPPARWTSKLENLHSLLEKGEQRDVVDEEHGGGTRNTEGMEQAEQGADEEHGGEGGAAGGRGTRRGAVGGWQPARNEGTEAAGAAGGGGGGVPTAGGAAATASNV